MQKPKTVILGSQSELKRHAVQQALDRLGVKAQIVSKLTPSGKNAQPYGIREAYEGAKHRAYANWDKDAGEDVWCIGIESGIMPFGEPSERVDIAVVFVKTGSGQNGFATSAGVSMPSDAIEEAQRRGFSTTTVAEVLGERLNCPADDPHAGLTGGQVSRGEAIAQAVAIVISQLLAN